MSEDEAKVITTGFQFVKSGISLDFTADTANEVIVMKGKNGQINLTIAEAGKFRNMLDQVINIVVESRDAHLGMDKEEIDFNNLPELE